MNLEFEPHSPSDGGPFHECTVRVRYAETDQMGVAYYANYLVWFEVGRSAFCRACGFSYQEMEESSGSYLIVAEASCRYRKPARYDQLVLVRTRLSGLRKRTVTFSYQLCDFETRSLLAEGETVHVAVDAMGKPRSIPEEFRLRLLKTWSASPSGVDQPGEEA